MKQFSFVLGLLVFLFFSGLGQAFAQDDIPNDIHLIFEDRILRVNFQTHPELLTKIPLHYISFGGLKIPVDLNEELPEIAELLPIETNFETVISTSQLKEYFNTMAITLKEEQDPIEIRFDDFENIIFEGGLPEGGFEIDYKRLVSLMNRALKEENKYIRVPAKKIYSQVIVHPDLKNKGIREIIAVGESNFTGSSPSRRQNILAATKKFNGTIIKKGDTFSFNKILKDVEATDGFVPELVIKGNETKKELGGGVCQVSTTAFRAAFNGGLPIINRRNHSYAVPYYKPFGLDATIYLGAQDFQFSNDTPGDLLVQAYVKDDDLYFVFYGTYDKREIQIEGPFISNYKSEPDAIIYETEDLPYGQEAVASEGHAGFRTEWVRHVLKTDGEKDTENIVSNYRPWAAQVIRGIGSSELESTPLMESIKKAEQAS